MTTKRLGLLACLMGTAWACGGEDLVIGERWLDAATTEVDGDAYGGSGGTGGAPTDICGDGRLGAGEQCDDSNAVGFDGCSSSCRIEVGFDCPVVGQGCHSVVVCGDGKVTADETCDDGNVVDGDGCAADCRSVGRGWLCPAPGRPCRPRCGDGLVVGGETCDDGNVLPGDGCSATCAKEPGSRCTEAARPCEVSLCGDGTVQPGEACDCGMDPTYLPPGCAAVNGTFLGDGAGCSATCTKEPVCVDASGNDRPCTTACGDANIDPGEACDDGNGHSGDGCSAWCLVEPGFTCTTVPSETPPGTRSQCVPVCGDGMVAGAEECDCGQAPLAPATGCTRPNDDVGYAGCTARCTFGPYCGDGIRQQEEDCDLGDDNGRVDGIDGCTLACTRPHHCGDGFVDGWAGEECDLGSANGSSGVACDVQCRARTP